MSGAFNSLWLEQDGDVQFLQKDAAQILNSFYNMINK